jgi:hypothetical protein
VLTGDNKAAAKSVRSFYFEAMYCSPTANTRHLSCQRRNSSGFVAYVAARIDKNSHDRTIHDTLLLA